MSARRSITGYELYARYLPAVLTALPILILGFYLSKAGGTRELIDYIMSLKFFGTLSMSLVLLYFYAQLIRTTSKVYENKYFVNTRGFPTTYFMLYSDGTYSEAFKDEFRKRVAKTLGIQLCGKEQEANDPAEARRRLNETTKQIILSVGNGELVGKHNQWYGFFRNLIGGCIYGAITAVISVVIGHYYLASKPLVVSSLFLFVFYCCIFIARKGILFQHAEAYARQLIAEFMKK